MNDWQIKGSWKQVKGKLKMKYAELSEDDLKYDEGEEEELIGRLQKKLGKTSDEIKSLIADFSEEV